MKTIQLLLALLLAGMLVLCYSCSMDGSDSPGNSETGQGGSMARFAICGDYLYTVDTRVLNVFSLKNGAIKQLEGRSQDVGFNIETIYPMDDLLFVGSDDGMHIYDISQSGYPQKLSFTSHIRSCDPVVAHDTVAYVTLNTATTRCNRGENIMQIYNITDLAHPMLAKEMRGFFRQPGGLGIDGNRQRLFVCDRGVKMFDTADPLNPRWVADLAETEYSYINAYDVIPIDGILLVTGSDGFFQFDYTSGNSMEFVSKIEVAKK